MGDQLYDKNIFLNCRLKFYTNNAKLTGVLLALVVGQSLLA